MESLAGLTSVAYTAALTWSKIHSHSQTDQDISELEQELSEDIETESIEDIEDIEAELNEDAETKLNKDRMKSIALLNGAWYPTWPMNWEKNPFEWARAKGDGRVKGVNPNLQDHDDCNIIHERVNMEKHTITELENNKTCFMDLPPELREMIWKYTFPAPRNVRIYGILNQYEVLPPKVHPSLPITLAICRESRLITLKHYILPYLDFKTLRIVKALQYPRSVKLRESFWGLYTSYPLTTCFAPGHDTLTFTHASLSCSTLWKWFVYLNHVYPTMMAKITSIEIVNIHPRPGVQNLGARVSGFVDIDSDDAYLLDTPVLFLFPHLKVLRLVPRPDIFPLRAQESGPTAVRRAFGSYLSVDPTLLAPVVTLVDEVKMWYRIVYEKLEEGGKEKLSVPRIEAVPGERVSRRPGIDPGCGPFNTLPVDEED